MPTRGTLVAISIDSCTIWYMTKTIEVRRTASAAPNAVWRVLSDLDAWPQWLPTVDRVARGAAGVGPGPDAVYRVEQPELPPTDWTVTDWQPGTAFSWRSRRPGVVSIADHVIRPLDDGGSEITLRMTFDGPLAWLAHRLYQGMTRSYLQTEAEALATRAGAEAGAGAADAE